MSTLFFFFLKKNNAWENVWVNPSLRMGMILTHLPMTLDGLIARASIPSFRVQCLAAGTQDPQCRAP